jgi:hypothetical protein
MTRSAPRHKKREFWRLSESDAPAAAISTPAALEDAFAQRGSRQQDNPIMARSARAFDGYGIGA